MAATYNFSVDAGATYNKKIYWKDNNGAVINMVGYTAKLQIRDYAGGNLVFEVTPTITVDTGAIDFTFTAAQTTLLTKPRYVYALELSLVAGSDPVVRLIEGTINVSLEVVK